MSYIIDSDMTARPRRRWPWLLLALLLVAAVGAGAFLAGRSQNQSPVAQPPPADAGQPKPQAPGSAEPGGETGPFGPLQWSEVAGMVVPRSPQHGPRTVEVGRASGYSHDEAGAVLAALNLSARLTGAAGPGTYESVLSKQTYGDQRLAADELSQPVSGSASQQTRVLQWWYRVTSGDPRGDLVEVTLLARTPQTQARGGYAQLTRTLAWRDGDWKVQVPFAGPQLVTSTAGFNTVGGPH